MTGNSRTFFEDEDKERFDDCAHENEKTPEELEQEEMDADRDEAQRGCY